MPIAGVDGLIRRDTPLRQTTETAPIQVRCVVFAQLEQFRIGLRPVAQFQTRRVQQVPCGAFLSDHTSQANALTPAAPNAASVQRQCRVFLGRYRDDVRHRNRQRCREFSQRPLLTGRRLLRRDLDFPVACQCQRQRFFRMGFSRPAQQEADAAKSQERKMQVSVVHGSPNEL